MKEEQKCREAYLTSQPLTVKWENHMIINTGVKHSRAWGDQSELNIALENISKKEKNGIGERQRVQKFETIVLENLRSWINR